MTVFKIKCNLDMSISEITEHVYFKHDRMHLRLDSIWTCLYLRLLNMSILKIKCYLNMSISEVTEQDCI